MNLLKFCPCPLGTRLQGLSSQSEFLAVTSSTPCPGGLDYWGQPYHSLTTCTLHKLQLDQTVGVDTITIWMPRYYYAPQGINCRVYCIHAWMSNKVIQGCPTSSHSNVKQVDAWAPNKYVHECPISLCMGIQIIHTWAVHAWGSNQFILECPMNSNVSTQLIHIQVPN